MTKVESVNAYTMVILIGILAMCIVGSIIRQEYFHLSLQVIAVMFAVALIRSINKAVEWRDDVFHAWQKTWFTKMM